MASRITEIVFDCRDPRALAEFWCGVLDLEITEEDDGVVEIGRPGRELVLLFVPTTDPRPKKLPVHLDVNAVSATQEEELQRLLALGATPADIGQGPDVSWHVLRDPEGNEFCLLRSTRDPLADGLTSLPAVAADIAGKLTEAGFTEHPHMRQTLALAEETGEFVGAVRRHYGMARRTGSFSDVEAELADVVITAFVTAHTMGIDLESALRSKLDIVYTRGWRDTAPDAL
jgi:NTP pyrophosphatase (non-canonical NTP hydrolase)